MDFTNYFLKNLKTLYESQKKEPTCQITNQERIKNVITTFFVTTLMNNVFQIRSSADNALNQKREIQLLTESLLHLLNENMDFDSVKKTYFYSSSSFKAVDKTAPVKQKKLLSSQLVAKTVIDNDLLGKFYSTLTTTEYKKRGMVFTPLIVVDYLLHELKKRLISIEEKIKAVTCGKTGISELTALFEELEHFFALKLCDFSFGSGLFLITSYKYLVNFYTKTLIPFLIQVQDEMPIKYFSDSYVEKIEILVDTTIPSIIKLQKIFSWHIFGVELDPINVLITKIYFILYLFTHEMVRSELEKIIANTAFRQQILMHFQFLFSANLYTGDALLGDIFAPLSSNNLQREIRTMQRLRKKFENQPYFTEEALKNYLRIKNKLHEHILENLKNHLPSLDYNLFIARNPIIWNIAFELVFPTHTKQSGFSFVVGNPPYIEAEKSNKTLRKYLKTKFESAYGVFDFYLLFIELGLKILKENGILALITSNKFFVSQYGVKLREMLLKKTHIKEIIDLSECPSVFPAVQVSPVILILKKLDSMPTQIPRNPSLLTKIILFQSDNLRLLKMLPHIETLQSHRNVHVEHRPQTLLKHPYRSIFSLYMTSRHRQLYKKIHTHTIPLDKIATIRTGIMGFNYHETLRYVYECNHHENNHNVIEAFRVLSPSLLQPFTILWGKKKVTLGKKHYWYPCILLKNTDVEISKTITKNFYAMVKSPKILVRGVAKRLTAAFDSQGRYFPLVAIHTIITSKDSLAHQYHPLFLLGLLNSDLFNWIHFMDFYTMRIPQGSLNYSIRFLKELPIPMLTTKYKQDLATKIEVHVKKILSMNELMNGKNTSENKDHEHIQRLNSLIYDLFEINRKEKQIIYADLQKWHPMWNRSTNRD